ncbi:archaeal DNA polymerase II, small subunit/DNA polymerase delta, subunit B [Cenarchaeum symbiosum A]|uniref:DNA polymerase II small subunit n=1 Tax=Cenarchaeum symbiosum (strain A) TaxID=414004 RepID=A0RYN3_CENSY|nr:archaeal DNA polymerase II, small subunit/DNA polymerase delta, subunit B [Cenarchaeum symbiosum A]
MLDREVALALDYALKKGFQVHPDALDVLEGVDASELQRLIRDLVKTKAGKNAFMISRDDLEEILGIKPEGELTAEHSVLFDPTPLITSAEGVEGYNALFASRFAKLKKIVLARPEASRLRSSASAASVKDDEEAYVCGLVTGRSSERNVTKVALDDPAGTLEAVVHDGDLRKAADMLLNDQFVMAKVVAGRGGGLVARELIMPDVPGSGSEPNRSESEVYAVFLSDLHIGSKYFLEGAFAEFVSWLSGIDPVARRVRYMIIGGDLVDGVGIFPNQDKELAYQTIGEQLQKADEMLAGVPDHVQIFITPGNHDPGRRALPQPAIPKKYHAGLWERGNVEMLGNPAMISLNGVKVGIFHGQSIDDIVKTTPGLSYDRPVDVMRHLLKVRHYSPIFGSQTPIAPETEDMMVIDEVPDIFHMGHVHVTELGSYRGVLLVNAGTWQGQTPFQSSIGQTPTPARAVLVNLKTFKVYYKDFGE